ncbi:FadR/GntR family transcriptional regulator [Leucobacter sp. M11]|uniref:FadR/GntR family transcriptional regulator n=1 Tax=Leucobacter sp. M11 TaxID=2993565 RepID=UPI002D810ADF|nr:GntR family transcriptional regulator [Leucobacter sp. M11]MEB4614745.1 GntR family transcriptional regulator [Leucobacter sp. M11]
MRKPAALPQVFQDGQSPQLNGRNIAEKIASSISLGMLSVGERLPPELELAQQFGVAVATLRKALAALREEGIVETRRGRAGGTFVVRAPFPTDRSVREYLTNTSIVELRDLGDEHVAVASMIARLAANRIYAGSTGRLSDLAARIFDARTPVERATADSRFHIEIAVLAQSPRLLSAELRLQNEISPVLWSEVTPEINGQTVLDDHLAIVSAIEQDRAEQAQQLSEAHIRNNIAHLINAKLTLGLIGPTGKDPLL